MHQRRDGISFFGQLAGEVLDIVIRQVAGVIVDFEGPCFDFPVGIRGFLGDVTGLGDGQVGKLAVVFGSALDVQAHSHIL